MEKGTGTAVESCVTRSRTGFVWGQAKKARVENGKTAVCSRAERTGRACERKEKLGLISYNRYAAQHEQDVGGVCLAVGNRGLFQRNQTTSRIFDRANHQLCLAYSLYPSMCDTLFDAGSCETGGRSSSCWRYPGQPSGPVGCAEFCRAPVANISLYYLRIATRASKEAGVFSGAIMEVIDNRVNEFFVKSLQLDAFTLQLEYK